MSPSYFQILTLFGSLAVFVAQWTGVISLRRSSAKLPWALMVVGLLTNTSTTILTQVVSRMGIPLFHGGKVEWWWILPSFGYVAFALGFALYGLQMARSSQRQGELEQLLSSMSEEMDRLRER